MKNTCLFYMFTVKKKNYKKFVNFRNNELPKLGVTGTQKRYNFRTFHVKLQSKIH